ncbi:hypothetical protein AB0M48_36570 [Lentzea sp. NPDC051208]|uniref:hypothetical protein n=1 Tax=Lentzea sp. NPDC051208 TaxID=3154642 RepID=UPI00341E4DC6
MSAADPRAGKARRVLIASGASVLVDQTLPVPPPADVIRYSSLPDLLPLASCLPPPVRTSSWSGGSRTRWARAGRCRGGRRSRVHRHEPAAVERNRADDALTRAAAVTGANIVVGDDIEVLQGVGAILRHRP